MKPVCGYQATWAKKGVDKWIYPSCTNQLVDFCQLSSNLWIQPEKEDLGCYTPTVFTSVAGNPPTLLETAGGYHTVAGHPSTVLCQISE